MVLYFLSLFVIKLADVIPQKRKLFISRRKQTSQGKIALIYSCG